MTALQRHLLIRADANSEIGHGHVMRCLALAQAWQDQGGGVSFACRSLPQVIAERLAAAGIEWTRQPEAFESVADAQAFLKIADNKRPVALVVDGYQFDTKWQSTVNCFGNPLLLIDDYAHLERYEASLLLNQNPGDHAEMYREKFQGRLLAGPEFTLLRREFLKQAGKRESGSSRSRPHLLVTLGGSDAHEITNRVLQAVESFEKGEFDTTLVSPLNGLSSNHPDINFIRHAEDMSSLMGRTDLAICGGGSTNWELCFFGIPRLVIVLAGNQAAIATELDSRGVCHNLGWHMEVTAEEIRLALNSLLRDSHCHAMADAGRRLVDGLGAQRVCQAIEKTINKPA